MKKCVDARGMQCPLPVIETKKAMKELKEGIVEVLVDNEISVQNLLKMAKQLKLKHSSEKIAQDYYAVTIELSGQQSEVVNNQNNTGITAEHKVSPIEPIEPIELCYPDTRDDYTIVVLPSDHMGEGDEQLGKALMKGFIYALTELDKLPSKIILYNGGAKLSVEGSDSLADLKLLESQGVEILTCGACLNFYQITEKLSVGSVTNMYAIAETMMAAAKIIKP